MAKSEILQRVIAVAREEALLMIPAQTSVVPVIVEQQPAEVQEQVT